MGIEIKGLDELVGRIGTAEMDEFCDGLVRGVTARLIDSAKKNTGVKTGMLRRGWTGGAENSGIVFMATQNITKNGTSHSYTLTNAVEYASYYEYGHRQTPGRYVPAIGKRLVASYVNGRYPLKKAEQTVNNELDAYVRKKVEKKLKEVFK